MEIKLTKLYSSRQNCEIGCWKSKKKYIMQQFFKIGLQYEQMKIPIITTKDL